MATMDCNDFLNHLDAWLEGDEHSEARAHASECFQCRGLVEDFGAIQTAARELSAGDPEPPARLWISLRAQLEQEGLIRDRKKGRLRGLFAAIPRPALAGAYLTILLAAAFAASGPIHRRVNEYRWIQGNQTAALGEQLNTAEQNTVASLTDTNPVVTASLHKNLAIVDNYIALCEKSVREDPENEIARDYLYTAYQQKADLLAQMADRGDYGR
jgi:fermentation-respiration switch protein FrsA (DUF1100 family)